MFSLIVMFIVLSLYEPGQFALLNGKGFDRAKHKALSNYKIFCFK